MSYIVRQNKGSRQQGSKAAGQVTGLRPCGLRRQHRRLQRGLLLAACYWLSAHSPQPLHKQQHHVSPVNHFAIPLPSTSRLESHCFPHLTSSPSQYQLRLPLETCRVEKVRAATRKNAVFRPPICARPSNILLRRENRRQDWRQDRRRRRQATQVALRSRRPPGKSRPTCP
jgi:hypothetical protein